MSYPKQTLKLSLRNGLNLDVDPSELQNEFYSEGNNILFRKGFAQSIKGSRTIYTSQLTSSGLDEISHIVNTQLGSENYWILINLDGQVWLITPNSATQIDNSLLAASQYPHDISSALINGIPVINCPFSIPLYWPGAGNLLPLPDWNENKRARKIVVFKYHIFALDILIDSQSFPNLVEWSSAAEPGTIPAFWNPDSSNDAGSSELADGVGGLLTALPMRDTLMLYKKSTTYAAQFVGGNSVFGFKKVDASHGTLNRNSVCDIGGKHFIVEQNDIVINDGTTRTSIGHNRIKDYLFNDLDSAQYEKLFVVYNRAANEVLISYPTAEFSECNKGIIYNLDTKSFSVRDLPQDFQLQSNVSGINHAINGLVDETPQLVYHDLPVTYDSVDIPYQTELAIQKESFVFAGNSYLEIQDVDDYPSVINRSYVQKLDLDFGDPLRYKFVKRIHVLLKTGFEEVRILVGTRENLNDDIVWSSEFLMTEPANYIDPLVMGKYISVEVRTFNIEAGFFINQIKIEAELRGYF